MFLILAREISPYMPDGYSCRTEHNPEQGFDTFVLQKGNEVVCGVSVKPDPFGEQMWVTRPPGENKKNYTQEMMDEIEKMLIEAAGHSSVIADREERKISAFAPGLG